MNERRQGREEDERSGYRDRAEAGWCLVEALRRELPRPGDALVLALPRGGVPVGYEVAHSLELPLDLLLVRKLGVPFQPELAMGAIAPDGVRVLNPEVVSMADLDRETIEAVEREERRELERRQAAYRGERPWPDLDGRTAILVDDGVATGSTLLAAIRAAKSMEPSRVVVAVPVSSPEAADRLRDTADLLVCPLVPDVFFAISQWYDDFPQVSDEEVRDLLVRAWAEEEERETTEGDEPGRRGRGAGSQTPEDRSEPRETVP